MIKFIICCFVVVGVSPVRAEVPIELATAQLEARLHAPEAAALDVLVRNADAIARDAGRRFRTDPALSLDYATAALSGELAEQSLVAGLAWTVDLTSAPRQRQAAARAARERASYDQADGLRVLDQAVACALANLAFAQRQLYRANMLATLFESSSALTQRRGVNGVATQLEIDAAALDAIGARADVAHAKVEVEHARITLARLLGRSTQAGLVAADPDEPVDTAFSNPNLVGEDPRIAAAAAALRSANSNVRLAGRSVFSTTTVGVDLGWASRGIPSSAFAIPNVKASWEEWAVSVKMSVPLPLVDRRHEERTQAIVRREQVQTTASTTRVDVAAAIAAASFELAAAADVWNQVAPSTSILDRQAKVLTRAFEAGVIDALESAQALRRLVEGGRRLDLAVRDLRIARAEWRRQTTR